MEWFCSTVGWTGWNNTATSEAISTYINLASDSASSWLSIALNTALFRTEEFIEYSLNGDYKAIQELTIERVNSTLHWLDFTPFQFKLLREFSLIFAGNTILVIIAWKVYGDRIQNKFMKKTESNQDELRNGFLDLKLPQEIFGFTHTQKTK